MKFQNTIIIPALFFGIIFLSGCLGSIDNNSASQENYLSSDTQDCGHDMVCFRQSMIGCKKATVISEEVVPEFFLCTHDYTCKSDCGGLFDKCKEPVCGYFYTCDLLFNNIDQYREANKTKYRAFEYGDANACTVEIILQNDTSMSKILTCTAPSSKYSDERFRYLLPDYCNGSAIDGFNSTWMNSEEKNTQLNEVFEKIEMLMKSKNSTETAQINVTLPYDTIEEISYDEVMQEYKYVLSGPTGGWLFDHIGPLPKEGGTYQLALKKEVYSKSNMEWTVYRVIFTEKINS